MTIVNRRRFLTSASAAVLSTATRSHAAPGKLNFVLILMDDLGWADLGCYGSTFYQTPNLDGMAATAVRFTDAYAACPVCSPTRAAVKTGWVLARHYSRTRR